MPNFDNDELRELIAANEISGISIDTNIFDSFSRSGSLDHQLLRALAKLKERHGVTVVLSDVVVREAKGHLVDVALNAHDEVMPGLKKLERIGGAAAGGVAGALAALPERDVVRGSTEVAFDTFLEGLGALVVRSSELSDIDEILDLYFSAQPPFASASKKAEFPDALAVTALARWADRNGKLIAVSNDKDWVTYFDESENVYPVRDLRSALSLFHEDDDLVAKFRMEVADEGPSYDALLKAVQSSIADLDFEIDYATDWRVDVEAYDSQVASLKIDEDLNNNQIISSDAASVTFSVDVTTLLDVSVVASFMINDSIDHDEVPLGSETFSTKVEHNFAVIITAEGKGEDKISIVEAEVSPDTRLKYVDFDYIGFSGFPPEED